MKTKLWLAACVLALAVSVANAATYQMQFTAIDFIDVNELPTAPVSPISGSFTYTADSPGGAITSFAAVELNIASHAYSISEVGYMPISASGDTAIIGGVLNGMNWINGNTTDFWIYYGTDRAINFVYSIGTGPGWHTWKFSQFSVTELQTPLPAALPLFATGLGVLGLYPLFRRRFPLVLRRRI